jgi:hypothetical protein
MKILLGDYNVKVGREDNFTPKIGNDNLHKISNDNGVKSSKLCNIQKSFKSPMFQHRTIHKFTWTTPDGKTHN